MSLANRCTASGIFVFNNGDTLVLENKIASPKQVPKLSKLT